MCTHACSDTHRPTYNMHAYMYICLTIHVYFTYMCIISIYRAFCKITFPGAPNFRWPFFRHLPPKMLLIYQAKISLKPISWENVLVPGIFLHSNCFSRKDPGMPWLFYLMILMEYLQIKYTSLIFPVDRIGTYHHKKPVYICIYIYAYIYMHIYHLYHHHIILLNQNDTQQQT